MFLNNNTEGKTAGYEARQEAEPDHIRHNVVNAWMRQTSKKKKKATAVDCVST